MFVDQVTVTVQGGVGGSGAEAFRHEYGAPRGGPSGGDGGDGGSVVLVCDAQLSTLLDFRYHAEYVAPRGRHGEGSNRTGRTGEDLELRVPPGTIVRDHDSGDLIGELLVDGQEIVAARGGRGGRGNARFATSTRQAPTHWEPGEEGERRTIDLTLKLIADVGLVGEPNAGKSTLLAAVTAARPKVADYPFTTLEPHLGVVGLSEFRSFVLADLPGIIEGAHDGKGLGLRFLRHIERTRTLALLVPLDDPDPAAAYARLRDELASYSEALAKKPHCLVFTKADLLGRGEEPSPVEADAAWGTFLISSISRDGVGGLLEGLWARVQEVVGKGAETPPPSSSGGAVSGTGDASGPDDATASADEEWWKAVDRDR